MVLDWQKRIALSSDLNDKNNSDTIVTQTYYKYNVYVTDR